MKSKLLHIDNLANNLNNVFKISDALQYLSRSGLIYNEIHGEYIFSLILQHPKKALKLVQPLVELYKANLLFDYRDRVVSFYLLNKKTGDLHLSNLNEVALLKQREYAHPIMDVILKYPQYAYTLTRALATLFSKGSSIFARYYNRIVHAIITDENRCGIESSLSHAQSYGLLANTHVADLIVDFMLANTDVDQADIYFAAKLLVELNLFDDYHDLLFRVAKTNSRETISFSYAISNLHESGVMQYADCRKLVEELMFNNLHQALDFSVKLVSLYESNSSLAEFMSAATALYGTQTEPRESKHRNRL